MQKETKKVHKDKVPITHTNSAEHLMQVDKPPFENCSTKCDLSSTSEVIATNGELSGKPNSAQPRRHLTHSNSRDFQGMHRLYSLDLQENPTPAEDFETFQENGLPVNGRDDRPPDTVNITGFFFKVVHLYKLINSIDYDESSFYCIVFKNTF